MTRPIAANFVLGPFLLCSRPNVGKQILLGAALGTSLVTSPVTAKAFKLELIPAADQATRMVSGNKQVASFSTDATVLVMAPGEAAEGRPLLSVVAINGSGRTFDFGPENIRICIDKNPCATALSHSDLVAIERKRAKRRRLAAAFAAAGRGFSAGSAGQYSGFGSVQSGGQRYNYQYSGTDTAASYAAQAAASRETQRDAAALRQESASRINSLSSFIQTSSVDPQSSFGGLVTFDPGNSLKKNTPAPLTIEVTAGSQTYRFVGAITRQ